MRVLAGRYELGSALGRGGMGEVFAAEDRRLGRPVAVKVLRVDLATRPEIRRRFEIEARAAARLSHPNVVTVFDSGEDGGTPFLVMERLPGRTLSDEIAASTLTPARVVVVARDVLAGLGAAHAAGIVHRDVKPGNILVGPDDHVKLTDFGIAKIVESLDQTMTSDVLATPRYIAPERLVGEPASPRSDVYSVGVVLYEALAGCHPFDDVHVVARLHAVEQGDFVPLPERCPDLPSGLTLAVDRAMARDPAVRFASAAEMARALSEEIDTVSVAEPADEVTARAVPVAEDAGGTRPLPPHRLPASRRALQSRRRATRRRGVIALVVAVALAAVLAAGLFAAGVFDRTSSPRAVPPATGTVATTPGASLPSALDRAIRQLEDTVAR
jgi:eukaryotic-like serine/threonine-protein kinase